MTPLLTQVAMNDTVLSLSREPLAFWPLLRQLKAAGAHGELRLVDEQSGLILRRYRLNDDPEEGDQAQPFSA